MRLFHDEIENVLSMFHARRISLSEGIRRLEAHGLSNRSANELMLHAQERRDMTPHNAGWDVIG